MSVDPFAPSGKLFRVVVRVRGEVVAEHEVTAMNADMAAESVLDNPSTPAGAVVNATYLGEVVG